MYVRMYACMYACMCELYLFVFPHPQEQAFYLEAWKQPVYKQ